MLAGVEQQHLLEPLGALEPRLGLLLRRPQSPPSLQLELDVDLVQQLQLGPLLEVGDQAGVLLHRPLEPAPEQALALPQGLELCAQRPEGRHLLGFVLAQRVLHHLQEAQRRGHRVVVAAGPYQRRRAGAAPRRVLVEGLGLEPEAGGHRPPIRPPFQERLEPVENAVPEIRRQAFQRRLGDLDSCRQALRLVAREGARQLKQCAAVAGLVVTPEVDLLDVAQKRRHRRVGQMRDHQLPLSPVPALGDEALPFVRHPRRGHRLRRHHQQQVVGAVEARLQLAHPRARHRQIGVVEEDFSRTAGGLEAREQVLAQRLHPLAVAVGVGQEDRDGRPRHTVMIAEAAAGKRAADRCPPACLEAERPPFSVSEFAWRPNGRRLSSGQDAGCQNGGRSAFRQTGGGGTAAVPPSGDLAQSKRRPYGLQATSRRRKVTPSVTRHLGNLHLVHLVQTSSAARHRGRVMAAVSSVEPRISHHRRAALAQSSAAARWRVAP